jgi:hypothetical protein
VAGSASISSQEIVICSDELGNLPIILYNGNISNSSYVSTMPELIASDLQPEQGVETHAYTQTLGESMQSHLENGLEDGHILPHLLYHDLFEHMSWANSIRKTEGLSDKCRNAAHILMQGPPSERFVALFGITLNIMSESDKYKTRNEKVAHLKNLFEENYLSWLRTIFTTAADDDSIAGEAKRRYMSLDLEMDVSIIDELFYKSAEIADATLAHVEYWDKLIGERTAEFFEDLRNKGVRNVPKRAFSPLEIFPNPGATVLIARADPVYLFISVEKQYKYINSMREHSSAWLEFILATPVAEKYIPK